MVTLLQRERGTTTRTILPRESVLSRIGRKDEMLLLEEALKTKDPGLIAVFGRRRVGKTFLIRNYFADRLVFELTGMYGGSLKEQLLQFSRSLQRATGSPLSLKPPDTWIEAFHVLEQFLANLPRRKKLVIFLDEFPWLDGRRSGFLSAFEHFWNSWASRQEVFTIGSHKRSGYCPSHWPKPKLI